MNKGSTFGQKYGWEYIEVGFRNGLQLGVVTLVWGFFHTILSISKR